MSEELAGRLECGPEGGGRALRDNLILLLECERLDVEHHAKEMGVVGAQVRIVAAILRFTSTRVCHEARAADAPL